MEKKTCGIGKPTCMWDGVCLGVKTPTGEIIVGDRGGNVAHQNRQKKNGRERWVRDNLNMIVGVPWRKNDDDPKVDGEHLEGDVVMDTDYKETWKTKSTLEPKRVYIMREDLGLNAVRRFLNLFFESFEQMQNVWKLTFRIVC